MNPAGESFPPKLAVFRANRGQKFMGFERKSCGEPFHRRQPDLLLPTGFDLLEEVLRELGNFSQLLLRELVALAELFQTNPNSIQGSHPSDRRDFDLTFLPANRLDWLVKFMKDKKHQGQHGGQAMQALNDCIASGGSIYSDLVDTGKAILSERRRKSQLAPPPSADRNQKPWEEND